MDYKITIYSTSWCGPCKSTKRLLSEKGINYEEIDIEKEGMSREDLYKITGGRTVPQIIINNVTVGGFDDLMAMDREGKL